MKRINHFVLILGLFSLIHSDALAQPHPVTNPPPLPPVPVLPPGYSNRNSGATTQTFSSFQSADSPALPPGGGGGGTIFGSPYTFDTNGLWLEITGLDTNGFVNGIVHNATNSVYGLYSATNLLGVWNVEMELWPTNSAVMPFTVQTLSRSNLFLVAEDWTGVTADGNTVPLWWLFKNYGDITLSDTNLDSTGQKTLLYDYQNGIDPNVIAFSLSATNNYIATSSTTVQLAVSQGTPFYSAVLVDSTNFSSTTWNACTSSNLPVVLGLTEGWHDVWIGLRGKPADATVTWQWIRMKLDFTPPSLVVTGPTNSTAAVQVVQVTGYSTEALASISYDISNAMGTVTNEFAAITGQTFSTNTAEFTTNFFQCYDVPLSSGLNAITIHATDLAGNTTTVVTNITYIVSTNLPAMSLVWPQNGMQISDSSITIQGRVDDPTANVVVATVDTNGNTNTFSGLTGRDGIFWAENVPLYSGTNQLLITASNAAGSIATNIVLVQSSMALTINSVQAGDTTVTGTIGSNGYTVWVNGNRATNDDTGSWTAQISPIGVGGGQVVAEAIPNSDNGGNGSGGDGNSNPSSDESINAQATVQSPQGAFISSYHRNFQSPYPFDSGAFWMIFGTNFWYSDSLDWGDGQGGTENTFYTLGFEITYPASDNSVWPANSWPESFPSGTLNHLYWDYDQYDETTNVVTETSGAGNPGLAQEHCDMTSPEPYVSYVMQRRTADTEMKLATGGPLGSTQMNLWCITATATAYTNIADTDGVNVPFDQIQIGGYGNLDTNGELWIMLPDNDPDVITPRVSGNANYTFTVGHAKYTLTHSTFYPAYSNPNPSRTKVGVGEQVSFGFQPSMPYALDWTTTAGSVSSAFDSSTTLTAPSNAVSGLTVTAKLRGGKSVQYPPFTVVEPSGIDHAKIIGTNSYPLGNAGAGMTNLVWIAPTDVSFYRVNVMEVGEDATNIWGYYSQWTPQQLHHNTADAWKPANYYNELTDWAAFAPGGLSTWAAGGYEWNIPLRWQVAGSGLTNAMGSCNGVFSITDDGTARVDKYSNWLQRTTNNVIITN